MNKTDQRKLLIIDGNSLIYRAFFALPPLTNRSGRHTNAVYGFLTMYFRVLDEIQPDYAAVAFDLKAQTFRHDSYVDYKAGRKKMPLELAEQIEPLKEILDALGLYRMELEGYEADDLIGTLARIAESDGIKTTIVSGDRDVLQLLTESTQVMLTKKGISQVESYDPHRFEEEYGIPVSSFIDLKGLMGDASDNIPGIPGIGPKTAAKLIQQFETMESMIQHSDQINNIKLREKVETHQEQAVLSKKLSTIMTTVPVEINMEELRIREMDSEKVFELFQELEFNSLLERISIRRDQEKPHEADAFAWHEITSVDELEAVEPEMISSGQIIFDTLSSNHANKANVIAAAFSFDGKQGWWIDLRQPHAQQLRDVLDRWITDPGIEKVVHDFKKEQSIRIADGYRIKGKPFDVMIADYLVNPSKSSYALEELSLHYFGQKLTSPKELWGSGKKRLNAETLQNENISTYLKQRISTIFQLYPLLLEQIQLLGLENLLDEVELPLSDVLAEMETVGIRIDTELLEEFEKTYSERIHTLTAEIYQVAGTTFNLNSPKQLGEVLFVNLKLPPLKKTKTGYSTDVEVLEKLKDDHEIVAKILEYRQLTKIKNTYIDGLLAITNPLTGRIHTTFHQTVAATGRISSAEPNLQNIPVRTEMGRQLRRVFIAREGWRLIDADYSQIELRIMAHLSGDPGFIKAFEEEADIHTRTAADIFHVSEAEVTPIMRDSAKAVNFGIIYGISDFGLSNNLHISRQQARRFIDDYLERYASVKVYMDKMVKLAKTNGYVTTLLNRIRYIPEIHSTNFNVRSFGERMAMNTPIQGSAADIIKIAMVRAARELAEGGFRSRLILQIHDELIVEAPEDECEVVSQLLRQSMEEAVKLDVPLKVELSIADNWFDAK